MDIQAVSNFSNWRQTNQLRGVQSNDPNTVTVHMAPPLFPAKYSSTPKEQSQIFQCVSAVLDPSENCLAVATSPLFTEGKGDSSCDVTILPILIQERLASEGYYHIDDCDDVRCDDNKTYGMSHDGWPQFYPTLGPSSNGNESDIGRCRLQCPPHVVPTSIDWVSNEGGLCADTNRSTCKGAEDLLLIGANKGRIFMAHQDAGNFDTASTTLEIIGCLNTSEEGAQVRVVAAGDGAEQQMWPSSLPLAARYGIGDGTGISAMSPEVLFSRRPPDAFIATTTIRCVTHSRNSCLVAAVCGSNAHVWDLNIGNLPISTLPVSLGNSGLCSSSDAASSTEVALTVAWAEGNNVSSTGQVLAIGGVAGTSFLVDRRTPNISVVRFPPVSQLSINRAVKHIEFSPVLPYAVAVSNSSGHIGIIDIRKPSVGPMRTIEARRGAVTSVKWLPHHADMIASGGGDGTVRIWSVREEPCYVMATAQLPVTSSVASLVVPGMYASPPTIFAVTACGQVATIRVNSEMLLINAPRNLQNEEVQYRQNCSRHKFLGDESSAFTNINKSAESAPFPPPPSEATLKQEHQLERYLYSRNLIKAADIIVTAAKHRYSRGDYEFGLFLCSLLDSHPVPDIDMEAICTLNSTTAAARMALRFFESQIKIEKARQGSPMSCNSLSFPSQLLHDMKVFSTRIPSNVLIESLRGAQMPSAEVTVKIKAIRSCILLSSCMRENVDSHDNIASTNDNSNILLLNLVDVCTAELIPLLKSRPDLVDPDLAAAVVRKLLKYPAISPITPNPLWLTSIKMIRVILDTLTTLSSDSGIQNPRVRAKGRSMAKRLLIVACEPLITDTSMCSWKTQRKLEKKFVSHDMQAAKEAVYVQLEVLELEAQRVRQELQQREQMSGTRTRVKGASCGTLGIFLAGPPAPAAKTIVSLVGRYQSSCTEKYLASQSKAKDRMSGDRAKNHLLGVFTWLGRKPLLSYLNALRACGHFTAYVWTTQQLLEHYAPYNAISAAGVSPSGSSTVSLVGAGAATYVNPKRKALSFASVDGCSTGTILIDAETMLFRLIDDIIAVTNRVKTDLQQQSQLKECDVQSVKNSHSIITHDVFPIIIGLVGFAMELQLVGAVSTTSTTSITSCTSIFNSGSHRPQELPPLVRRVVTIVSTAVSEVADSFSSLLNFMGDSKLATTVVKATIATDIDAFATKLDKEVEKKTNEMKTINRKESSDDSIYAPDFIVFEEASTVAEFVLRECDDFLVKVNNEMMKVASTYSGNKREDNKEK